MTRITKGVRARERHAANAEETPPSTQGARLKDGWSEMAGNRTETNSIRRTVTVMPEVARIGMKRLSRAEQDQTEHQHPVVCSGRSHS